MISLKSLRSKLIASFLIMSIITITLVVFTITQLVSMFNLGTKIMLEKQPTELYSFYVLSGIQKSNIALANYISSNNERYTQERRSAWSKDIKAGMDSLEFFMNGWDEAYDANFIEIQNRVDEIRAAQETIENIVSNQTISTPSNSLYGVDTLFKDGALANSDFTDWFNNNFSVAGDNKEAFNLFLTDLSPKTADLDRRVNEIFTDIVDASYVDARRIFRKETFFKVAEVIAILIALAVAFLLFRHLSEHLKKSLSQINESLKTLSGGDLPKDLERTNDEFDEVLGEVDSLTENLGAIKEFASEVGSGNFETDITVFDNQGEIGQSLAQMRDSLLQVAEEERERRWFSEGISKFSDIVRKHSESLELLCREVIVEMVRYLDASQGGLFVVEDNEEGEKILRLAGMYAFDRHKYIQKEVLRGQGLSGQCWVEKKTIHLREIPNEYVKIRSGLGGAHPNSILIIPLILNEEVFGVIEIASFKKFKDQQVVFLEKLGETLASFISNVRNSENTRKLLEEAQEMTSEIRSQEEEARQNMEEMSATQEEMKRNQRRLEQSQEKNKFIIECISDMIIIGGADGKIEEVNAKFVNTLKYDAQRAQEMLIQDIVVGIDMQHADGFMWQVKEYPLLTADGLKVPCSIFFGEIYEESGTKMVLLMHDLSDENKLKEKNAHFEDQIRQLEEAMDALESQLENASQESENGSATIEDFSDEELTEALKENQNSLEETIKKEKFIKS